MLRVSPKIIESKGEARTFWIQIILVLVFIFSRYWSKSIIRTPPWEGKGHESETRTGNKLRNVKNKQEITNNVLNFKKIRRNGGKL